MRPDPVHQEADDLIARFGELAPAWAEHLACRHAADGIKESARTWRMVRDAAISFLASARSPRAPLAALGTGPALQGKHHADWTTGDHLRLEIIGGIGAHANQFPQRWGRENVIAREQKIASIAETVAGRIEHDFRVERLPTAWELRVKAVLDSRGT